MRRLSKKKTAKEQRTHRAPERSHADDRAAAYRELYPPQAWRRLHEGDIIAEASLISGMGSWRVTGYRINGGVNESVHVGGAFSLLTDAHRAADTLVQEHFNHTCRVGVCGRWLRWRRDEAPDT